MAGEERDPFPITNCQIGLPILTFEVWLIPWGELHPTNATTATVKRVIFISEMENAQALFPRQVAMGNPT